MNLRKSILVMVALVALAAFFFFDLHQFLTLEALKANRQRLQSYAVSHALGTATAFMAIYVFQTALSLP
jgi:hypothetical protein